MMDEEHLTHAKVVKNFGTHKILAALYATNCTTKQLKSVVGAINSVKKFEDEYMARMLRNEFVVRNEDVWVITQAGIAKYIELGPAVGMQSFAKKRIRRTSWETGRVYMASDIHFAPRRPGSMDFMYLPSLMGGQYVYLINLIGW